MNYEIEYRIEPREVFRDFALLWKRLSLLNYTLRAVAVGFLIWTTVDLLTIAHYWTAVLMIIVIPAVALPGLLTAGIFSAGVALWKPHIRVSFDEDGINYGTVRHSQFYPWTSFATAGSVTESDDFFDLNCGRGDMRIPARVFSSPEARDAFRTYLREHLPECCRVDFVQGVEKE